MIKKEIVLYVVNLALSIAASVVSAVKDKSEYEKMKREIIDELSKK